MTQGPFRFETLGGEHDRATFRCGDDALDGYFRTQVTEDIHRRITTCFVVVETATSQAAAYYTLVGGEHSSRRSSAGRSKALAALPHHACSSYRPAGRRPALPTPGSWRTDADERGSSGHSGRRGRIRPLVDSKNDQAAAFYQRYGFHPIVSKPETLFLPLAAALKTLFLKGAQ